MTGRYRKLTALAVLLVAAIAAVISYQNVVALALRYGQPALAAYMLPVSIDSLVAVSSLTMLRSQGVPAQCSTNSPGHGNSYAYKVFSMQLHVKASPGGQAISQASLNVGCTGPGSGPSQPTAQVTLGYQNPGVTPFASLTEATPYHRFCTRCARCEPCRSARQ